MGLSSKLSCEAGSFSCCLNPHRFLQPEVLRLHFPSLEPWVAWSVSLPSCSSQLICMQMWDHLVHQLPPACLPWSSRLLICHESSLPWLTVSTPPTGVCECFFFNSLVIGFPYSSIFCHFWLFFVFKFVVVLLLIVGGGNVWLPTPPSWPEVLVKSFYP